MGNNKRWIAAGGFDSGLEDTFSRLGVGPVTAAILHNRGICNKDEARRFLFPELSDLHDPFLLNDMENSIKLICDTIRHNKKIIIYGDYDTDGITSTSILYLCLKKLGVNAGYYIPNRADEGYGLNAEAISDIVSTGAYLIITVDCGVSAISEVQYLKSLGAQIIITDHHECGENIPETYVINPKRKDSSYPFKELSGAGVSFKLVQALSSIYKEINPVDYMDLAAIGTVADIVPIIDENRVIVKYGLDAIKYTSNNGIRAILDVSGIDINTINSGNISFSIAPRINSIGRLNRADKGVELFISEDKNEASCIAGILNESNKERQKIEEQIFIEADELIQKYESIDDEAAFVLESDNWHIGVIGIVASRIVEKYYKPVILLSRDGDVYRGSARSIPGVNIFEVLTSCRDLLVKYGGHAMAAGLSIQSDNIDKLRNRISSIIKSSIDKNCFIPALSFDLKITPNQISSRLIDELNLLEPFGQGNPSPVFMCKDMSICDIKTVGTHDKHLKMKLLAENQIFDAIAFNMGYNISGYSKGSAVDILCGIDKNIWNGCESVQLRIKDIRISKYNELEYNYYQSFKRFIDRIEKNYLDTESMFLDCKMDSMPHDNRSLLLCGGLHSLEKLYDFYDDIEICFETNYNVTGDKPVAIVNPDFDRISFAGADNIYLLDNILDYHSISKFCSNINNIKWHVYYKSIDSDINFINSIKPSRQDMKKVYSHLSKIAKDGVCYCTINQVSKIMSFNILKVYYCLRIMSELGIITVSANNNNLLMITINQCDKTSMDNSNSMQRLEMLNQMLSKINLYFQKIRGNIHEY